MSSAELLFLRNTCSTCWPLCSSTKSGSFPGMLQEIHQLGAEEMFREYRHFERDPKAFDKNSELKTRSEKVRVEIFGTYS